MLRTVNAATLYAACTRPGNSFQTDTRLGVSLAARLSPSGFPFGGIVDSAFRGLL